MTGYTQSNRPLQVFTVLPDDTLLLRTMRCQEALGRLFQLDLELVSTLPDLSPRALIGTPMSVSLRDQAGRQRWIDGYIRRFSRSGGSFGSLSVYHAEVVPWLWFLTQMSDCRIFQDRTTLQILDDVVKAAAGILGLPCDVEIRDTTRGNAPREYCVQYRETHFNFLSRLLEDEGLTWFFVHERGAHRLVVAEEPSALPMCPHQATAWYAPGSSLIPPLEDIILTLSESAEMRPGRMTHVDYNFETPSEHLVVGLSTDDLPLEVFDFPGLFRTVHEGDDLATVRMEERRSGQVQLQGSSNIRHLCPGHRFILSGWPGAGGSGEPKMVVTGVHHHASQEIQPTGATGGGEDASYSNSFTCVPVDAPLRPPRRTPKPAIYGTQTAVVQGKQGEEIWTDPYGRIKVKFHWDREDRPGEERSCWIRVAQTWAGQGYGAFTLPRIGQEVVVSFLEGDPDRPLVIGSVYNAGQMPPYPLPDDQTRTTLKSNSSKGGGGFNELRFEDRKDSEEVFLHAQKDYNEKVLNNHSRSVDANEVITVGGNRTVVIKGNQNVTIQGKPEKGGDEPVDGEAGNAFSGAATSVTGKYNVSASDTILITAPTSITLQCGGSSIVLTPGAITLVAGGGSTVVLDANAFTASSQGSSTLLDANALMVSSGASQVLLDANALMTSSGGSQVLLDSNALAASSGGSQVLLDSNALMASSGGSQVLLDATATVSASAGGEVKLDANAQVSGAVASLKGAGASATMSAATAEVTGPIVKLN